MTHKEHEPATVTLELPARFYDDHADRDLPAGTLLKRLHKRVIVELDAAAYGELLNDADHYSDNQHFADPHLFGLTRSAAATAARLRAIETPWTPEEASAAAQAAEEAALAEPMQSQPWDRTPGEHVHTLAAGESVPQPGSTSRRIYGPCVLRWRAYADGGIDATIEDPEPDPAPRTRGAHPLEV